MSQNYFEYCETRGGCRTWLDEGVDPKLDKHNRRMRRNRPNEDTCKWYVNLYRIERCYGGPEEGGWFYDGGELLKSYGMYSKKLAYDLRKLIEGKLKDEKPTYHTGCGDHDGVDAAGDGDDHYLIPGGAWGYDSLRVKMEPYQGANYPIYRPTYC